MGREAEVTWTLPKGGGGGEGEGKDEDEGQVVARVLVDLRGATRMGTLEGMDEDEDEEEVVLVDLRGATRIGALVGMDEDEEEGVLVGLRGATRMEALVGMDEDEEEGVLVVGVVVVADTHLTAPAAVEVVVVVIDLSSRTCRQQRRV